MYARVSWWKRPGWAGMVALVATVLICMGSSAPEAPMPAAVPVAPAEPVPQAPAPVAPEEADAAPQPVAPPDAGPARIGAILPLEGEITDLTYESIERRIAKARAQGASVIVLELNTPGGLVSSTIDIGHMLRNCDVHTVAWVNPQAYSGGAIVALACNEIVMARSSTIGDSQVIIGGPEGVTTVPKELQPKYLTPVIAELRQSAKANGYSPVLCEALTLPEMEVWWVRNTQTGEERFVDRAEKRRLLGEPAEDGKPESGMERIARSLVEIADGDAHWELVDKYYDVLLGRDTPTSQPVVEDRFLLQMSASEAQAYGFSKGVVSSEADLLARYNLSELVRLEPPWSEHLAFWLTSMYVRGFLLFLLFMALYVEFHTPGVGVAGLVALVCLAIVVGAPYLTGLANAWEVALIIVGLALIVAELFVIPGFGVTGIAGLLLLGVGLVATFVPEEPGRSFPLFTPSLPATVEGIKAGIVSLGAGLTASLLGMLVLSRYLPRSPLFNAIAPDNPTPADVAVDDPYSGAAHLGDRGVTCGPLRPAGKARFGSLLVDVVSQGEFIEAGVPVEVVERWGNRVVVRPKA